MSPPFLFGMFAIIALCLSGWYVYHQTALSLLNTQNDLQVQRAKVKILQNRIRTLNENAERSLQDKTVKHNDKNNINDNHVKINPPPPVVKQPPPPPPQQHLFHPEQVNTNNNPSGRKWLIIGIPTVPRTSVDYLTPTVEAILQQLPDSQKDPFWGRVQVVVLNQRPKEHRIWEIVRDWVLKTEKGRIHFIFVENEHP